jgi:PAS domain-containing protein
MSARNSELASFLGSRRRRLTLADIGLSKSPRRRSTWPTREEVAWAADGGITWYTWLEQGRPIKIAAETLNRIARALRLNVSETEYLHKLARAHPAPLEHQATVPCGVRGLVEGYAGGNAFVIDPLWDLLYWNQGAARLLEVEKDARGLERNALWLLFTRQHLRRKLCAWHSVARRTVAALRVERSDYDGNGAFEDLIAALSSVSAEFREMWSDHEVLLPTRWSLGPLRDEQSGDGVPHETVALPIPESQGQTIIFHYPTASAPSLIQPRREAVGV